MSIKLNSQNPTPEQLQRFRDGLGLGPVATMSLSDAQIAVAGDWSPQKKFQALGANKIGFNCFDLLRRRLLGGTAAQSETKLDWIAARRGNIVRIMHPAYNLADFQSYVYAGAIGDTVTDATFRPAYLALLDECFDLCAARGIKLWVSLFWWEQVLPGYFGETVAAAMSSTTSATVRHMAAHHRWFAARYRNHPAMGIYSFGNEYHMGDGVTDYATPSGLGAVFSYLADQIRSVDRTHIITADMLGPSAGTSVSRELPESYFARMRTIYAGLDAWAPHIYGNDTGFVGRNKSDGAIGALSTNISGYESTDALMAAFRSEADAQGKPLFVGEFGVPTDIEADTASGKAGMHFRQMARGSDLALVWNVQLQSQADTNQVQWFIEPGTTRAAKFEGAILPNQGRSTARAKSNTSATAALKTALRPTQCWRGVVSPNGRIAFTSDAAMSGANGFAFLTWISLYSDLSSYQIIADFRSADTNSGAVLLGENSTPNQLYVDFRKSGGSAGNSIGSVPALQSGRWYHLAVMHQQDPAVGSVIDVWIDGLLYKSYQGSGAVVSPAAGTTCTIGGASNGAPLRLQDFAVMPYASADDVGRHLSGEVLPQSWVHVRATGQQIIDASRHARALTVGSSVTTERI